MRIGLLLLLAGVVTGLFSRMRGRRRMAGRAARLRADWARVQPAEGKTVEEIVAILGRYDCEFGMDSGVTVYQWQAGDCRIEVWVKELRGYWSTLRDA